MKYESESIEYKVKLNDGIYKEIIAFANTDGGIVYVGVDDKGEVIGLEDVDEVYTKVTNGIRDAVRPDVTMFVRCTLRSDDTIEINVQEGSSKPYYLKSKGMKPSGVFVRQGASSVQASPDRIRMMIKDSDGDVFEEMRSVDQDLTFSAAASAFKKYGVDFSENKYPALGINNYSDKEYTNLALILSDQCPYTVKIAVFDDENNTIFKDAKEFGGSIFTQLEQAYSYLKLCNHIESTFEDLKRIEKRDYPSEALREGLINALIHRDYGFSGSIIINVNSSRIEFISIGGLMAGLSTEDIKSGISQPRNRKLAEVFHRLKLVESYGTGIRRIYSLYDGKISKPAIITTPNTFKLVLPNMNVGKSFVKEPTFTYSAAPVRITEQMRKVVDYLRHHGEMTGEELQELLHVKQTRAYVLAKEMRDKGIIEVIGRGPDRKYRLK